MDQSVHPDRNEYTAKCAAGTHPFFDTYLSTTKTHASAPDASVPPGAS